MWVLQALPKDDQVIPEDCRLSLYEINKPHVMQAKGCMVLYPDVIIFKQEHDHMGYSSFFLDYSRVYFKQKSMHHSKTVLFATQWPASNKTVNLIPEPTVS